MTAFDPPPVFAVGTGRCGTRFLALALAREPRVAAYHERHPLADAFQRYCVWNGLAVDPAGFLATKAAGIHADLERGVLSFEASAYLALSTPQLQRALGARFVLLVRRPDRVVRSLLAKGWFEHELERADPSLPAGYQPAPRRPHHPFSRLAGVGADGARWQRLSRVGKLAYYWRRLNEAVLRDFATLPGEATRVVPIEGFGFAEYRALAEFVGFDATLGASDLLGLARSRPNSLAPRERVLDWTPTEVEEFESEVAPLAEPLGYEWRCDRLRAEERADEAAPAPATGALRRVRERLFGR